MKWLPLLLLLTCNTVLAHSSSNAYLNLGLADGTVTGTLRLRLQDVPWLADMDSNDDSELTWNELQDAEPALHLAVGNNLSLHANDRLCTLQFSDLQLQNLNTGVHVVLPFTAQCPLTTSQLVLQYNLLFDTDASHRGIVELRANGYSYTGVATPSERQLVFDTATAAPTAQAQWAFVKEGVWHIWAGYDHLLFLLALMLPLFLLRDGNKQRWLLPERCRVVRTVLWTVTAFTLAHSLTLLLATLLNLQLASAAVETVIAASVALSGLNVLVPIFSRNHAPVAFCFGLVHGLGFAGALHDLQLPTDAFVRSLLGFNIGVEAGQLALVALAFPLLMRLRKTHCYQRFVQPVLALAIFGTGIAWAFERGLAL